MKRKNEELSSLKVKVLFLEGELAKARNESQTRLEQLNERQREVRELRNRLCAIRSATEAILHAGAIIEEMR